jgi:hypothetical protein
MAKAPATAPKHDARDLDEEGEDFTGELPALPAEFGTDKVVDNVVGFPPYWEPGEPGNHCDLIPQYLDTTDTSFLRIVCKYIGDEPLQCMTGSKGDDGNSGTPVEVRKGELFTIGWYATLPLEFGMANQVPIRVVVVKKSRNGKNPDGTPKMLWHFKYQTSERGAKQISAEKQRAMAFGPRNVKNNPQYLIAFTPEGMRMSAPSEALKLASGQSIASPGHANAEA